MQFTIELEREEDGRWIADIPALNLLQYGNTKGDAVETARKAALEIVQDRIAHGELPHETANLVFAVAA